MSYVKRCFRPLCYTTRHTAVGRVTGLWAGLPTYNDSITGTGMKISLLPKRPDWFWEPTNLLFKNGESFLGGKAEEV
jgi:hypothetical protein